jgi:hypothetical protein
VNTAGIPQPSLPIVKEFFHDRMEQLGSLDTTIFGALSHFGQRFFDAIFGSRFYLTHIWAIGSMLLLTGISCWFLGSFLTFRETISLVDDEGFEKQVHPSHDFF